MSAAPVPPQWPLDHLVAALRDLHSIVANEAADRLTSLDAKVAAVAAAIDRYDASPDALMGDPTVLFACVSAIAKAVER